MLIKSKLLTWLCLLLILAGCARGETEIKPAEIRYGEDLCSQCNMIINDPRFASSYVYQNSDGRYESLAFDDIGDLLTHGEKHPEHQIVAWYVHDYATEQWIDATSAYYVVNQAAIATPMGHGLAAHATRTAATQMAQEVNGEVLDWTGLQARSRSGELHEGHTH